MVLEFSNNNKYYVMTLTLLCIELWFACLQIVYNINDISKWLPIKKFWKSTASVLVQQQFIL